MRRRSCSDSRIAFETNVHEGKANVRVVARNAAPGNGGGSTTGWDLVALLALVLAGRVERNIWSTAKIWFSLPSIERKNARKLALRVKRCPTEGVMSKHC
jgi:hypothetical protein